MENIKPQKTTTAYGRRKVDGGEVVQIQRGKVSQ